MSDSAPPARHGLRALIAHMVTVWALWWGGAALAGIVAVNVFSAAGTLAGRGFAGDFELTELLSASAIFAFLPYAQLTRAHVAAEIFTARAGARYHALAASVAGLIGAGIAAVLMWRMALGMADQQAYGAVTAIMQVPVWWAYGPALISLGLWIAAALVTMTEAKRDA